MLDTPSPLNTSDPIDRNHPLNFGLVADWTVAPGLDGGKYLYDLMGPNPGTLTNFASSSGWRASPRQGGSGQILTDGVDDHIRANGFPYSSEVSFFAWASRGATRSLSTFGSIAQHHTTAGTPSDWYLYFNTGNQLVIDIPWVAGAVITGATAVDANWHHIGFTRSGSSGSWAYKIYLDGKVDAATTTSSNPAASAWDMIFAGFVSTGSTVGNFQNLMLDAARVYGRALSAAEVFALCDCQRRGSPGIYNRVGSTRATAIYAAPTATIPRLSLLGVG